MIYQKEIYEIAEKYRVKTITVDKDWVLGHFLNAMFSFEDIRENFVFKGGTCLRKCYFPDYRFSEDLDFTLLNSDFPVNDSFIRKIIKKAEEISGIKFSFERNKIQISKDIEQGYEIKIKYWGADHKPSQQPPPATRWHTFLKLDISHTEKILTDIQLKPINHNYSDKENIVSMIPVYSIEEIVAEKLRSLMQRNRPRDIYDLWYLLQSFDIGKYKVLKQLLTEKCDYKNIGFSGVSDFVNEKKSRRNKREWESSLNHHLPEGKLPGFDTVYQTLHNLIDKILIQKI